MKIYVNDVLLVDEVKIADTFLLRLKGLLGKRKIKSNEGLLLMNCPSVHCFFMKFPIDAIYLSDTMTVLYKETIEPWRIGKTVKKTAHILELYRGRRKLVAVGDKITIEN